MKKIRIILPVMILIICSVIFTLPASALGEAMFVINKEAVNVDDSFELGLQFSATENIGKITATIAYDPNVLEFISGKNASGGGGTITINDSAVNSADASYSLNFKAKDSGNSTVNIVTCNMTKDDGSRIGSPTAYANITAVGNGNSQPLDSDSEASSSQPQDDSSLSESETSQAQSETSVSETESQTESKPENTENGAMPLAGVLSSLSVDNGNLTPDFAWNVYDYTVNVGYDVTNVEIEATGASPSDYLWYTGSSECQVGENIRTISVTDTYGNQTTYTVKIIRADENETVSNESEVKKKNIPQPKTDKDEDVLSRNKGLINSALIIILVVLIIALVVIVVWIRNRMSKKNKKDK